MSKDLKGREFTGGIMTGHSRLSIEKHFGKELTERNLGKAKSKALSKMKAKPL